MCLNEVSFQDLNPEMTIEHEAWKVFDVRNSTEEELETIELPYYSFDGIRLVERGVWLKSNPLPVLTVTNGTVTNGIYTSGFHCFPNENDAEVYACMIGGTILKIKARGLMVIGTTWATQRMTMGLITWVVSEMFVLKDKVGK